MKLFYIEKDPSVSPNEANKPLMSGYQKILWGALVDVYKMQNAHKEIVKEMGKNER